MITKPQLRPKAGYVEVEVNGERLYKNAMTGILLRDETPPQNIEADILEATLDLAVRVSMLENGVTIT